MKKFLLTLLVIAMPLVAGAQVKFGYFSFSEILNTMPDRAAADRNLADLRIKYDAEMKRAENEFNVKYEEFLEGQRDFVPSILHIDERGCYHLHPRTPWDEQLMPRL